MKSSHPTGLHYFRRNPHPKKENHGDCGVRAICLALDLSYNRVWSVATDSKRREQGYYYYDQYGNLKDRKVTATWSLSRKELEGTLRSLRIWNWNYTKLPKDTKFVKGNFPDHCIAHLNRHWVAIKDGAIWDTWDSRGKRLKEIRGYFSPAF